MAEWLLRNTPAGVDITALADRLTLPDCMARVLAHRGITTPEQGLNYFTPDIQRLADPAMLTDMSVAVERLIIARHKQQVVRVVADDDVDGMAGAAVIGRMLKLAGIPGQIDIRSAAATETNVNTSMIDALAAANVDVLIFVDQGMSASKAVDYALNQYGIDTIICDHHTVNADVPRPLALLNPAHHKDPECIRDLSASGVAFKLAHAVLAQLDVGASSLRMLLSIACLGTIADQVPLIDDNRQIAALGLQQLNSRDAGNAARLHRSRGPVYITADTVRHVIGPRINAAGRLHEPNTAVHLLMSDSAADAQSAAERLEFLNMQRREEDRRIYNEVRRLMKQETENEHAIILYSSDWPGSAIGGVAARLAAAERAPVVLLTRHGQFIRGSARSGGVTDVLHVLNACVDLFEAFGGHPNAAGFTIMRKDLDTLKSRLREAFRDTEQQITPFEYDAEIPFSEIHVRVARLIRMSAPHGNGNPAPLFRTRDVQLLGNVEVIQNRHIRLTLAHEGVQITAIGFHLADFRQRIYRHAGHLDIIYEIEEIIHRGTKLLRLKLRDILND